MEIIRNIGASVISFSSVYDALIAHKAIKGTKLLILYVFLNVLNGFVRKLGF